MKKKKKYLLDHCYELGNAKVNLQFWRQWEAFACWHYMRKTLSDGHFYLFLSGCCCCCCCALFLCISFAVRFIVWLPFIKWGQWHDIRWSNTDSRQAIDSKIVFDLIKIASKLSIRSWWGDFWLPSNLGVSLWTFFAHFSRLIGFHSQWYFYRGQECFRSAIGIDVKEKWNCFSFWKRNKQKAIRPIRSKRYSVNDRNHFNM